MRRVVVTGMGLLSPMGRGVETTWQGLIQGKSAITPVTRYDVSESPAKIAGQIPFGTQEGQFDPDSVMAPKEQRRVDPFILYGICAGTDAVEDSGWKPGARPGTRPSDGFRRSQRARPSSSCCSHYRKWKRSSA